MTLWEVRRFVRPGAAAAERDDVSSTLSSMRLPRQGTAALAIVGGYDGLENSRPLWVNVLS